jgi:hypothetical protein
MNISQAISFLIRFTLQIVCCALLYYTRLDYYSIAVLSCCCCRRLVCENANVANYVIAQSTLLDLGLEPLAKGLVRAEEAADVAGAVAEREAEGFDILLGCRAVSGSTDEDALGWLGEYPRAGPKCCIISMAAPMDSQFIWLVPT